MSVIDILDVEVADRPVFHLRGAATSYLFRVTRYGHLEHLHFGAAVDLGDHPLDSVATMAVKLPAAGEGVKYDPDDTAYNLDRLPLEYSGLGKGDYRLPAIETTMPDGSFVTDLRYVGHRLHDGVVPCEDGLPTALAAGRPCQTLQVDLADGDLALTLYYTAFPESDVVTRRAVLTNRSQVALRVRRLMSQLVDLPDRGFDLVTFDGAWISEAHRHVRPLAPGIYVNSSITGFSSNRHNPGVLLARRGARHRKRAGDEQPTESERPGSGAAIAIGALLDGVPEPVVLGLSLLGGGGVGVPVLAAIFVSNLPEGLSSAAGMKRGGRSAGYVFGVWIGIAVASGLAGLLGCLLLQGASAATIAVITAVAAGAILTMIADTMIPEAFERTHLYAGLIAALGFLTAFVISRA